MRRFLPLLLAAGLGHAVRGEDRFPAVSGRNLHGETITFPAAFAQQRCTLVIVAYLQQQQETIDPWLPELTRLAKEVDGFDYFELPTIKPVNPVLRWVIYRGMRSGIPSAAARSRTVTLHLDKGPFNETLGVTDENEVRFFLVDDEGRICWRATGERTGEKLDELRRQVAALTGN